MSKRKAIRTSEKRATAIVRKREAEIRRESEAYMERTLRGGYGLVRRIDTAPGGGACMQIGPEVDRDTVVGVRIAEPNAHDLSSRILRGYFVEHFFRAVIKRWADGHGNEVRWVEWEPCGSRGQGVR